MGLVSWATPDAPRRLTAAALAAVLVLLVGLGSSGGMRAQEAAPGTALELLEPASSGDFGEPITYRTTVRGPTAPLRVELVTRLPGDRLNHVRIAELAPGEEEGTWQATLVDTAHVVPNTRIAFRFRAVSEEGSVLGPEAEHLVRDERLEWRTLTGDRVTIHWHRGSEEFARRALEIGEEAVDRAASLLGVEDVAPVDFFAYADGTAFREALGPATREQVGGQANTAIRTLFGLIQPAQVNSDWVTELVAHELTHLVFDDAVSNPWNYPPRWLNEGLAVHLSAGYDESARRQVQGAAGGGLLMPLDALTAQFPTSPRRFSLSYAQSVSAVDFFVRRHGEERLATLITAYAGGVSDDEAFQAATGEGFRAFEDAWLSSVGSARPEPFGPLPAPPGPAPPGWEPGPVPLLP
jgi:hypothetical protein